MLQFSKKVDLPDATLAALEKEKEQLITIKEISREFRRSVAITYVNFGDKAKANQIFEAIKKEEQERRTRQE